MCYDLMLTVLDEQVVDKERREFQSTIIIESSPTGKSLKKAKQTVSQAPLVEVHPPASLA